MGKKGSFLEKVKKYFKKKWAVFKEKGYERITLMIIPHNRKNLLSFQLSKFTIGFISFIIITIFLNFFLSWKFQKDIKEKFSSLYSTDQTFYSEHKQYLHKFENISESQSNIKNSIKKILELINEDQYGISFFSTSERMHEQAIEQIRNESHDFYLTMNELLERKKTTGFSFGSLTDSFLKGFEDDQMNDHFQYNNEVIAYRKLYLEVQQIIQSLTILESFLRECEEVRKSSPYYWPIAGGYITSKYGPRFSPFGHETEFHLGIDLANQEGTPVYAAADGTIASASKSNGYGKTIRINHRFGYKTLYAHLRTILVKYGKFVQKGDMIGRLGSTGRTTGPHLHFEVKMGEKHIDPFPFLRPF